MSNHRSAHSTEFKIEAVKMVVDKGLSCQQVADEVGVHVTTVRNWKKQFQGRNIDQPKKVANEIQEIRKLQETVRQLKIERDILKKATAIFAK